MDFIDKLNLQGKFSKDVVWNMASLGFIGTGGIVFNILIGRYHGAEILGVFSQVMTIYIVFSQIAAAGIHFSVQKFVPEYSENLATCDQIISSAFLLTTIAALIVCLFLYLLSDFFALLLQSPNVSLGLVLVLPGLLCFAQNKVLLVGLNGLRHMRAFAVSQSLRVFIFLFGIIVMTIKGIDGKYLPLVFTIAEVILLLILIIYFYKILPFRSSLAQNGWYLRHLKFGKKAFLSGILADINPRIDVLVLGIFTSDAVVGVYTFSSMIAEGVAQIPVVIQNNLNPILTKLSLRRDYQEITRLISNTKRLLIPVMAIISILVLMVYPLMVEYIVAQDVFYESWPILLILLAGSTMIAGYSPFYMILNQAGHPAYYSIFLLSMVIINIVCNFLLVPVWGMYGAAVGTLVALIASVYLLKYFMLKVERVVI